MSGRAALCESGCLYETLKKHVRRATFLSFFIHITDCIAESLAGHFSNVLLSIHSPPAPESSYPRDVQLLISVA